MIKQKDGDEMKGHTDKKQLERHAVDIFVDRFYNIFGAKYKILELRERPDALLETERGKKIGVEIAHLFKNQEEARFLLGKAEQLNLYFEVAEHYEDHLIALNQLLRKKEKVISKYDVDFPIVLLIRSATPDLTYSRMKLLEEDLYIPQSCREIWLLLDDSHEHDWGSLVKLK